MSDPHEAERRSIVSDRRRTLEQPHPDQIAECADTFRFYAGQFAESDPEELVRRILVTAVGWTKRRDALELQHARLRDRVDAWKTEGGR